MVPWMLSPVFKTMSAMSSVESSGATRCCVLVILESKGWIRESANRALASASISC